jgi:hypothetical protein
MGPRNKVADVAGKGAASYWKLSQAAYSRNLVPVELTIIALPGTTVLVQVVLVAM